MIFWLFIFGTGYVLLLAYATINVRRRIRTPDDYVMAGSNIGAFFGFLTFAATLFSTFTLLGMPDFFRVHGVGSWVFLAVADATMAFVIIWFAFHLRRRAAQRGFRGVAGLMSSCFDRKIAGYVYLAGVFVFLVPYVAVQVRGIGIFMNAVFPQTLPIWGWATIVVTGMLIYSELGGLKAIIYSDALQGSLLFAVTGVVAYGCVSNFGGIESLFAQVREVEPRLLSVPGPQGLFTTQFLIASYLAIILVPITQPQLTTRLVIVRDLKTTRSLAVSVGLFALLLVLLIIPIGFYGAVRYPDMTATEFLAQTLVFDQAPWVAAIVIVGLIAAAISTADSQIFALGTELRSLLSGDEKQILKVTKFAIFCFAMTGLVVAITSNDQLVLLARVSFAGTALMAPLILTGILYSTKPSPAIVYVTGISLAIFLISTIGIFPSVVGSIRVDLALLVGNSLVALGSALRVRFKPNERAIVRDAS